MHTFRRHARSQAIYKLSDGFSDDSENSDKLIDLSEKMDILLSYPAFLRKINKLFIEGRN
jgi:hypothetical protein